MREYARLYAAAIVLLACAIFFALVDDNAGKLCELGWLGIITAGVWLSVRENRRRHHREH